MENEKWICACGQENDGKFCIQCGSPKREAAPAAVAPAAPVEAAAPVAPAVAPIEPAAPVEAAAPVAPAVAPIEPAAAVEAAAPAAPAVAPIEPAPVAPVAAAAVIAAATPDEEPVQVIKCQPMPETPMEDYSSVPSDPEFADAEAIPVQPVYQPAPAAAPVAPVTEQVAAPKQVGPVNYQNTSSNPYSEPDRASHNPYAPAPVAQPQANYGGGYAAPVAAASSANTGTSILILGIASIVVGYVVGIILGAIGCSQAKKLKGPNGEFPTGKAKIGSVLSLIGLILSIAGVVLVIIACIICAVLGVSLFSLLKEALAS